MHPSHFRAKTAEAAEIVGISYDGLRSWLKRGLLKTTGNLMPKFYAANTPAEVMDAKRWQWSEFRFEDLCAFKLMKILLDAGLPWKDACDIASKERLWWLQGYAQKELEEEYSRGAITPLATYLSVHKLPHSKRSDIVYSYCLYTDDQLATDLKHGLVSIEHMILVSLPRIRQEVVNYIEAIADGESRDASALEVPAPV